jgi:ATP synthase protein I
VTMAPEQQPQLRRNEEVREEIARKAARKQRSRGERERGIWFGLGMFGLVGWAVAVPTVAGIALGVWIDHHYPGRVSWTLTLLVVGVALGCWNAWFWVRRESAGD